MEVEIIIEGEIEKKVRVICPTQPDKLFNLPEYGTHKIKFQTNGAGSVIIVSDTFRPSDIFKTTDLRKLGIRFLKGITLVGEDGSSNFISLYSMYGAKKIDEISKINGVKPVKLNYSYPQGKINLSGQFSYNHHRSGLSYMLDMLSKYHREDATVMDTWLERTFAWEKQKNIQLRLIPYREPWVGFFHHPPNTPNWFSDNAAPCDILNSKEFQDSLPTCKGIYVFSQYHADFLKCFLKSVLIEVLPLTTENPQIKFNFDDFINNNNKKIINIGYWLRKLSSIYQLDVDQGIYQKIRLLPAMAWVPQHLIDNILEIEQCFRKTSLADNMRRSVIDVRHMPDEEYDKLLSKNVVFLDLYDASANNSIVECIIRGTPVLVNRLPAVIEYLGKDYPFYFSNLAEASEKLREVSLVKEAHEYLTKNISLSQRIEGDCFLKRIQDGEIWKSL